MLLHHHHHHHHHHKEFKSKVWYFQCSISGFLGVFKLNSNTNSSSSITLSECACNNACFTKVRHVDVWTAMFTILSFGAFHGLQGNFWWGCERQRMTSQRKDVCPRRLFRCVLVRFPLTLSWRRLLSYRNQPTDLLCKSIDWFLYDRDLRQERVKASWA